VTSARRILVASWRKGWLRLGLQTAFGLMLTSSVSGFVEMSFAGPAAMSGTIWKFGFTM